MNPIAIGIPGKREAPVVLDVAFAMAARGRVILHRNAGEELPDGWALDKEGNPTNDPNRALDGLMRPIAGYKGAGLAVAFGLLASCLGGAAFGVELGNFDSGPIPHRDGLLVLAINPEMFGAKDEVLARMDRSTAALRESSGSAEASNVTLPGDRARAAHSRYSKVGIRLHSSTIKDLVSLCDKFGIKPAEIR